MSIIVTAIEKQGPVIICSTNDYKNRTYKLDFEKAKVYGISGSQMQSTYSILDKIPNSLSHNPLCAALRIFKDTRYSRDASYYSIVESLLSYPDLIEYQIDLELVKYIHDYCNNKLPKGFVAWCRKNDKTFLLVNIKDFMTEQVLNQWPQSLSDSIKRFFEGTGLDLVEVTHSDKELCTSLMHIINNTLKRYEFENLMRFLSDIISALRIHPYLRPYLDDTKSAKVARQILIDVLNKERNNKILENEAKISALNGTVIDNLMIKIPSTLDDFTNEGEQQHNCIGHFYHDSIADGYCLIYFLRHIENPDKSYVTCRYDLKIKETVEHRLRNNNWFEEDDIFKKIDCMIANLLKR